MPYICIMDKCYACKCTPCRTPAICGEAALNFLRTTRAAREWSYQLAFDIGDFVRYKNRIGRDEGYITAITIRQTGIRYEVTWSNKQEDSHYDFELELLP